MKVFVTKWALTQGIEEMHAEQGIGGTVRSDGWRTFLPGEWHRTLEEAVAKAETLRVRKIASLKKQLAKLEAMTFDA